VGDSHTDLRECRSNPLKGELNGFITCEGSSSQSLFRLQCNCQNATLRRFGSSCPVYIATIGSILSRKYKSSWNARFLGFYQCNNRTVHFARNIRFCSHNSRSLHLEEGTRKSWNCHRNSGNHIHARGTVLHGLFHPGRSSSIATLM
jgi:hypothetical protein